MPVYLKCTVCGIEFSVSPNRAKTAKACSSTCGDVVRAASRSRRVSKSCEACGANFQVPRSHVDRRRFCSHDCKLGSETYRLEKSLVMRGSSNPMWKGGKSARLDGYSYVSVGQEHPFSTPAGYMLEHRAIMERWLRKNDAGSRYLIKLGEKTYLSPDFQVHHRDEDKQNNDIRNLQCVTLEEHRKIHAKLRRQKSNLEKGQRP